MKLVTKQQIPYNSVYISYPECPDLRTGSRLKVAPCWGQRHVELVSDGNGVAKVGRLCLSAGFWLLCRQTQESAFPLNHTPASEVQFCKLQTFWKRGVVMVTQQCDCTYYYRTMHLKTSDNFTMYTLPQFKYSSKNFFKKHLPVATRGDMSVSQLWDVKEFWFHTWPVIP